MTIEETAKLLAKIALIENKSATDEQIVAWAEILSDVMFVDANEALVRHYKSSTESVKPAHIYRGAKEAKQERTKKIYGTTNS